MREYAVLGASGSIVNIVTTPKSLAEVAKGWPEHTVKPLDQVPLSVCEQYQYWSERS